MTLPSVLAGISKCFKTAAIVLTQCDYHKSEWFVNPPVLVYSGQTRSWTVKEIIFFFCNQQSYLLQQSSYLYSCVEKKLIPEQLHHRDCVNLVLVIYLDQLKDLKCPCAIYKEYSYQGSLQDISPQVPTRPGNFGTTRPILLLISGNNSHLYQTQIKSMT